MDGPDNMTFGTVPGVHAALGDLSKESLSQWC